ncbi:hypothetical protein CFP56_027456 [Quercus suber]|uniref:Uncharacterized protein n=1 Tax=Quercus suber TaxID=58331 RepID=A0AAW0JWL1_QUESU
MTHTFYIVSHTKKGLIHLIQHPWRVWHDIFVEWATDAKNLVLFTERGQILITNLEFVLEANAVIEFACFNLLYPNLEFENSQSPVLAAVKLLILQTQRRFLSLGNVHVTTGRAKHQKGEVTKCLPFYNVKVHFTRICCSQLDLSASRSRSRLNLSLEVA